MLDTFLVGFDESRQEYVLTHESETTTKKTFSFNFVFRTLRSTTVSGMSNSPTIHNGMAPPHGFALSILRSNITVSNPRSCAKISAAQAPEGPPPTTATLYLISMLEPDETACCATDVVPWNDEVCVKALAPVTIVDRATMENFIFDLNSIVSVFVSVSFLFDGFVEEMSGDVTV